MTLPSERIATLDAVRGFAVMGILLLNIVDFAMPSYAYVDPNYYGGATGINWWTWATVYVLADGKMRGLFTMLFGASTILIAERAAASGLSPARVHYARMGTLFGIGMIHAYLIWAGDILVLYALCGAIVFPLWRWRSRALLALGCALLAFKLLVGIASFATLTDLQARATRPDASTVTKHDWRSFREDAAPAPESANDELRAYRASWTDAARARTAAAIEMQTEINIQALPDTLALMVIGMALFRLGFFAGAWSRRRYLQTIGAGAATIPAYCLLVAWIDRTHFSPVVLVATDAVHLTLLRPLLSLAWASAVIRFMQSGAARWLAVRLAATGRAAFSNYLGTSIVCTLIFNGYGLGWFGYLERWQLYPLVFAIWVLMLLWSKPWLDRFCYGPLEWAWRSLAQLKPTRFRLT